MLALTLIICAVSALILPVTVKLRLYVDFNDKRAFYSIFLFGFIRVNSGYLSIKENLLTVHFSDSKAYAAELKSLMPNKNSAIPPRRLMISDAPIRSPSQCINPL